MKYILLGIALLMVVLCEAHVCIFNPRQRGTMNGINASGANDCKLLDGPCGGRPPELPKLAIVTGEPYGVVFQKNLNHFNPDNPGRFLISLSEAFYEPVFEPLETVLDSDTPSLHVYEVNVTFPSNLAGEHVVLQVEYVTNNPKAPPVFYQCADVYLIAVDSQYD